MGQFAAKFADFARTVPVLLEAIPKEAAQEMVYDAQRTVNDGGRLPIDTGFLRASLVATSVAERPGVTFAPEGGGTFSWDAGQIGLVLDGINIAEGVRFTYQAAYAMRQHYGFQGEDSLGRTYNQAGKYWVTMVAQNWQRYINSATARVIGGQGALGYQAGR